MCGVGVGYMAATNTYVSVWSGGENVIDVCMSRNMTSVYMQPMIKFTWTESLGGREIHINSECRPFPATAFTAFTPRAASRQHTVQNLSQPDVFFHSVLGCTEVPSRRTFAMRPSGVGVASVLVHHRRLIHTLFFVYIYIYIYIYTNALFGVCYV